MIDLYPEQQRFSRCLSELAMYGVLTGDGATRVQGICDDSRKLRAGDMYMCLPRAGAQAQAFVSQAINSGAAAIMIIGDLFVDTAHVPQLRLPDMHAAGQMLRDWFHTQQTKVRCIGITGTDGKTSVTWMLREALSRLSGKAWSVGTLGWIQEEGTVEDLGNTTPSLLTMHRLLAMAQDMDVSTIVCEVSSHGIEQQRIAGIPMDVAVWTNLGHDHLEDHGGFEAYAAIKAGFIRAVSEQYGVVVCASDDAGVMARAPDTCLRFGHDAAQHPDMTWTQSVADAVSLHAPEWGCDRCIEHTPQGAFHAANLACTALVLSAVFQVNATDLPRLLSSITAPPGRMQALNTDRHRIFIDYAHTPEALNCCLNAARQMSAGRVLLVFGCGGERDHEKRPKMGAIAAQFADEVWITSDNPRGEDPECIAYEIVAGVPIFSKANTHLQLDRKQAIVEAIHAMQIDDVLIIAGKGHENYMEINHRRIPWRDDEIVMTYINHEPSGLQACA